jgi:hypothetical protein
VRICEISFRNHGSGMAGVLERKKAEGYRPVKRSGIAEHRTDSAIAKRAVTQHLC